MNNYSTYPITKVAPVLAILGAIIAIFASSKAKAGLSFTGTSLMIIGAILTAGFALFPFLLPSNINPNSSLTMGCCIKSPYFRRYDGCCLHFCSSYFDLYHLVLLQNVGSHH